MSGAGFETVIFDFDYTLADSSSGVIECVNYALSGIGLTTASHDAIRRTIGLSLPHTLEALAGREHAPLADEFQRLFIERADDVMADATRLYDFVPKLTDTLLRHGIALGIVSSKFRRRIQEILQRAGIDGRFGVIVGGEDVAEFKPHPWGLLHAVASLNARADRCLYVGDSVTDAETAKRAEIAFAAALSGVTPRAAFAEYAPYLLLASAAELPAALGIEAGV